MQSCCTQHVLTEGFRMTPFSMATSRSSHTLTPGRRIRVSLTTSTLRSSASNPTSTSDTLLTRPKASPLSYLCITSDPFQLVSAALASSVSILLAFLSVALVLPRWVWEVGSGTASVSKSAPSSSQLLSTTLCGSRASATAPSSALTNSHQCANDKYVMLFASDEDITLLEWVKSVSL